jgi:hypothetical protein
MKIMKLKNILLSDFLSAAISSSINAKVWIEDFEDASISDCHIEYETREVGLFIGNSFRYPS